MGMREMMARAMAIKAGINPAVAVVTARGKEGNGYWTYMTLADAALDALMEPTEGMVDAGLDNGSNDQLVESPRETFIRMIRAAKEGK